MKRLITIFNLIVNVLFIVSLFLSGYAAHVSPEKHASLYFFGLAFIPLVIANLLFVAFWIIKLRWYFVFSLISLLLVYGNLRDIFPIHKKEKNAIVLNDSSQISILSYNVKLFDFYKKEKKKKTYNKTIDYILKQNADIVCLQEFGYFNERGFLNAANILIIMGKKYKYRHIDYYINSDGRSTYGVATFSKYPILKKKTIEYNSKFNYTICSDIQVRNRTIHLFNCHLESNQLTVDDKKGMFEVVDSTVTEQKIRNTTSQILQKLALAAKQRAHQADRIAEAIKACDSTVIVCGDFNDSPNSYTYDKIKGDLTDVFAQTSSGMGISYRERPFLFRIDYIMHSNNLKSGMFTIDRVDYSDHYPIRCIIDLNKIAETK